MSRLTRSTPTYAQRYCERHKLLPEQFAFHALKRGLHRPWNWLWWLLRPFAESLFARDLECIQIMGSFRSWKQLQNELVEFSYHPVNRSLWRSRLGLRISTTRIRRNFRALPRSTPRENSTGSIAAENQ